MKLSDAIRLGAMLKPQGNLFLLTDGRTCALGAALDAIGQLDDCEVAGYPNLMRAWPWMERPVEHTDCPACNRTRHDNVREMIWHLNDDHKWTREQIADWVETMEVADTPVQAEPVAVKVLS